MTKTRESSTERELRRELAELRALIAEKEAIIRGEQIPLDLGIIRGQMVRKLLSLLPRNDESRSKSLLVFGTVFYDELLPLINRHRLKCPHVRIHVSTDPCPVPRLVFNANEFSESNLSSTINQWMQENGADDLPQDQHQCWSSVLSIILRFTPSQTRLPEEQFRSRFWAQILHETIFNRLSAITDSGPEFKMKSIPAYGADARVDYEMRIRTDDLQHPFVVLLLEASGPRIADILRRHKDLGKLVVELQACMMSNTAVLRNAQSRPHLMFGILTSGPQIRFCFYSAYYKEEHGWTFVFQSHDDWFLDLADPAFLLPSVAAGMSNETGISFDASFDIGQGPVADATTDRPQILGRSNRLEDWTSVDLMCPNSLSADLLMPRLQRLMEFCDLIVEQVRKIHSEFTLLNSPEREENMARNQFPQLFRPYLPRSSTSNVVSDIMNTPERPANTTTVTVNGTTYRGPVAQAIGFASKSRLKYHAPLAMNKKVSVIICDDDNGQASSALIVKPFVEIELKALKMLQYCPNIARLYDWCHLEYPYIVYHQEYLTPSGFPRYEIAKIAVLFFINTILDALNALQSLQRGNIIHRDITPANFLYCPRDGKWELTDFNLAVIHSNPDTPYVDSMLVGTKGYHAPETLELYHYSSETDVYSMARTLQEPVMYSVSYIVMASSSDGSETFYDEAESVVCRMLNPDPLKRGDVHTLLSKIEEMRGHYQSMMNDFTSVKDW